MQICSLFFFQLVFPLHFILVLFYLLQWFHIYILALDNLLQNILFIVLYYQWQYSFLFSNCLHKFFKNHRKTASFVNSFTLSLIFIPICCTVNALTLCLVFLPFCHIDYIISVCYYHVTCAFQNGSTLHSCLNFKEHLAQNRRDI